MIQKTFNEITSNNEWELLAILFDFMLKMLNNNKINLKQVN